MAINTDSLITLESGGVTYGKIGVSKSLNQVSIDDIWDAVYCSSDNPTLCEMKATFTGETPWFDDVISPLTFMERTTGRWNYGNQELCYKLTSGAVNTAEQLYGRVVWLYTTENPYYETHRCVKSSNASAFKLITQMNVQQFELLENDLSGGYSSWGNRPKPSTFNDTNIEFMPYLNLKIFEDSDTQHNGNNISASNIYPYIICKFNDKICLFLGWDFAYWLSLHTKDTINETGTGKQFYYLTTYDGTTDFCFNTSMRVSAPFTTYELDQYQDYYGTDINEQHLTFYSKRTDHTSWREIQIAPSNKTSLNAWISRFGMYFRTDKKYKPIVVNGYVSGFTDDFTIESEIDNYTGQMQHTVPDVSPSGGGGGGDNENEEIKMPLAYIGGTGGFVQFIKINSAGLASADDISAALSRFDITTIGKDLLRNFVSYKCFAVLSIDPDDAVTRQIKVDGHALTDEKDQPLNGQIIGSVLPIDFEIGTPTRYFNDFRDYAPYTKIEAYVPFCGWFSLPSWCIGRKITGTMFTDLYNGTVKAVIFAGSTVVAEIGGCCAYDIPFVADATGAKAGAVISSALSTAAATAATVTMPNVATGIAAVTSAANTLSALNSNDTTLKGVLGDGSNLNGLLHCYLKITRPQSPTRNNKIPNAYKHEFGIPTYKELTLATGDGYTQVMDANIEGTMTDREKQMIIDGFKHGLIL